MEHLGEGILGVTSRNSIDILIASCVFFGNENVPLIWIYLEGIPFSLFRSAKVCTDAYIVGVSLGVC